MGKNVKWVHAPAHVAASHWLPDGYSLPIGGTRAASRLPFAIGETLTLYEAAQLISGRHPYPLLDDGVTTLGPHMEFISAGSTGRWRQRVRALRSVSAFKALQQKVMSDEIHAEETPRLSHPGTISDGGIDWLNVKVATAAVVRLCEEKGWRCGILREPLTTSAPLVGKSSEDILRALIELRVRPGRHREWPWKRVQSEMVRAAGDDLVKGLSPRNIQRKYQKLVAASRSAKVGR